MKDFLSDDVYDDVEIAIKTGKKIDRSIADHVAAAMKAWAMGRGASHYTHWFQPLTELQQKNMILSLLYLKVNQLSHLVVVN